MWLWKIKVTLDSYEGKTEDISVDDSGSDTSATEVEKLQTQSQTVLLKYKLNNG
jgi:hypothetical protein